MFGFFSKKKKLSGSANKIFLKIIDHTRSPVFYTRFAVDDSLDGRFDLMTVHMVLVLEILENHEPIDDARILGRTLQEIMFDNLDLTLREIGVGDLGVSKKIKVMAEAFFGRMATYQKLFNKYDIENMSLALKRNLYRGKDIDNAIMTKFAKYVYLQITHLKTQSVQDIMTGKIDFLLPDEKD